MKVKFRFSDFSGKDPEPVWFQKFLRFLEFQFLRIKEPVANPVWTELDSPPTCYAVDQRFHGLKNQVVDADAFTIEGNADLIAPYTNSPLAGTAFSLLNFVSTLYVSQLAIGTSFYIRYQNRRTGLWTTWSTTLASPLTTKGDIWVFSTGDTRLPVGTDYQVLSALSSTSTGLSWTNISSLPKEQFYPLDRAPSGLLPSIDSGDTAHDWSISLGWCWDTTFASVMYLSSSITKRADATWAVGTGNGGMESGTTFSANTTYFYWLIMRTDTGVVDALFSASETSPTMPTNYDRKRLIGILKTQSGAASNILVLTEIWGNQIKYRLSSAVNEINVTNLGNTRTTYTMAFTPACLGVTQVCNIKVVKAATQIAAIATALDETDVTPSATLFTALSSAPGGATANGTANIDVKLNSSAQFGIRSDNTSVTLVVVNTGYFHSRSI